MRSIEIIKSQTRRKTISLTIHRNGQITLRAPRYAPLETIKAFLKSKQEWIKKTFAKIRTLPDVGKKKRFRENEVFPYLGENLPLRIESCTGKQGLSLDQRGFLLNKNLIKSARQIFVTWYKNETYRITFEKIRRYSTLIKLTPKKIKITSAQKRWGSCTAQNSLNFSYQVACLPSFIIDYIVVHELAHIAQKNHSSKFWSVVAQALPGYKTHRSWLKKQGQKYQF